MHDTLNITIIQPDITWEDKDANFRNYERYMEDIKEKKEVVILPEMFSTGFSMNVAALAEPMDGRTMQWMREMAAKYRCILTGSFIVREDEKYFNRLVWMQPDGNYGCYDKRHLFAYAGEDEYYSSGNRKLIAQVKGWKICLLICYDLRFPVWSRNRDEAYDVLVYVANWPERRSLAWRTLLQARAIENMSYVAGVNRTGDDGKNIHYKGESSVFGPLGERIWQGGDEPAVHTLTLTKETVQRTRSELPFLKDCDAFMIL